MSGSSTTTTIVLNSGGVSRGRLQASLVGLAGSVFGSRFLLADDIVDLGREEDCGIVIDDVGVSRRHARIRRVGEHFYVSDTGSKNGVIVHEERIEGELQLNDGDLIQIGKSVLKFLRLSQIELRYHDKMAKLTNTDALTGAYNRRHAWDVLVKELSRADRRSRALSIVMFDIDHFKKLNDSHGHAAGDAALVGLVQRVTDTLRTEDVLARIGGEEFLIVLPDTDVLEGAELATRVRDAVANTPFDVGVGGGVTMTVSLGVADLADSPTLTGQAHAEHVDNFVAVADAKLYEAKHLGRNRVVI